MTLRDLFRVGKPQEQHSLSFQDVWGRGDTWMQPEVWAGVPVSQDHAQRLTTVARCIDILCGTLAALPWDGFVKDDQASREVPRPARWLSSPNPETTPYQFRERIGESLATDGNAFVLITARDAQMYPAELWTLNPHSCVLGRSGGRKVVIWEGSTRLNLFTPANPAGDVIHIPLRTNGGLRGLSPLDQAKQAVGLSLVTEKFGSRYFGSGQRLSGVIELPAPVQGGAARSKEYIDLMRETWEAEHGGSDKAHKPGILTGGATWKQISVTPEDSQFLETRKFQVEEICRIYGVPPHMVGHTEPSTSWGTGIEQQSLGFLRFTLLPWIVRIEESLSQLLPRGQFVKLNQRALLRSDAATEAQVAVQLLQNGVLNFDDVLGLYERESRPGGNRFMIPANMELLEPDGSKAKPAPVAVPNEPAPSPNGTGRVTEGVPT